MDRGYVDFGRLYRLHQADAFFVTRAKSNMAAHRVYSAPVDRATDLICDQTIALDGLRTRHYYPEHLLRLAFRIWKRTRDWYLSAIRWHCQHRPSALSIRAAGKWNLRIKTFFYGTSDNAVKTQIWIAVSVYVLIAIVRIAAWAGGLALHIAPGDFGYSI
jgi:hypothetical protein